MKRYVEAEPYSWPYNGDLRPENTVFPVIDMQTDFCAGRLLDRMGYDLSLTRAPIEPIQRVFQAVRAQNYHVFHTREGHRPTFGTCRRTSAGAVSASAPALRHGPCGRILTAVSGMGDHPRT